MMKFLAMIVICLTCVGCTTNHWKFNPQDPISITNNQTLANVGAYATTYSILLSDEPDLNKVDALITNVELIKTAIVTSDVEDIMNVVSKIVNELPDNQNKDIMIAIIPKVVRTAFSYLSIDDLNVNQEEWVAAIKQVVVGALDGVTEAAVTYRVMKLNTTTVPNFVEMVKSQS